MIASFAANCFDAFLQDNFPPINSYEERLGYLIGSRLPRQIILAKIQSLVNLKQIHQELEKCFTEYKVTPLHIAVMRGDETIVNAIIAQNPPLDAMDDNGCTPLHIAAIAGNDQISKMLVAAAKANEAIYSMRNKMRATAEEIRMTLSHPSYPPEKVVCYYKNEQGFITPVTAQQCKGLLGFDYCPYVVYPQEAHFEMWFKTGHIPDWAPLPLTIPSPLYLEKEKSSDLGLGVRAQRLIPAFEVIDVYGGSYQPDSDSLYAHNNVDATHYGTLCSRINDGDPNCLLLGGFENGLEITRLVSIQHIPSSETLWLNYYHTHPCKWGYYAFQAKNDLQDFCSKTDFLKNLKQFHELEPIFNSKHISSFSKEYWESLAVTSRIHFIFTTPRVLAELLLKKHLSLKICEQIFNYLANSEIPLFHNKEYRTLCNMMNSVMKVIQLANQWGEQGQTFLTYLCQLLGQHRVICVLQEILTISHKVKNLSDLKTFQEHIELRLTIKKDILSLASERKLNTLFSSNKNLYNMVLKENLINDLRMASSYCFDGQTDRDFRRLIN